ncbi:MAG: 50S ribosome-binding GTPase [Phycisphaerales bacterium]|nr:50S ribosome-binding GTPase [Phycisphaerales bacterium]
MNPDQPAPIIAAIGSPPGSSSRGLVRASGDGLHHALARITSGPAQQLLGNRGRGVAPGRLQVRIAETSTEIPALFLSMPGPASFTGEDSVEIQLAGNPALLHASETAIVDAAINSKLEARTAGPGEFTARAYLSGRIGLLEAEGVAATIAARNDRELEAAQHLRESPLAERSRQFAEDLTDVLGLVEAGIDFTDEEAVQALSTDEIRQRLDRIRNALARQRHRSDGAEAPEGLPKVALAGAPNAGKSTLFNALLGQHRTVVSSTAGTTRDSPSEPCGLVRRRVILVDTAGLGRSEDQLAHHAHEATLHALETADLVLLCVPLDAEEQALPLQESSFRTLRVFTRSDLAHGKEAPAGSVAVSGLKGTGLDDLREAIEAALDSMIPARIDADLVLLPRHETALLLAEDALLASLEMLKPDPPAMPPRQPEVLAEHVRTALEAVASLDGGLDPEAVLGVVFSRFCVGK